MSHNPRLDEPLTQILPLKLDGYTVLDAGCGYGYTGLTLRHRYRGNYQLWGVDKYLPYLDALKSLGIYDKLETQDISRLPYADKQFDIVICLETLEHLPEPDAGRALRELERVCSSLIIVSSPNGYAPITSPEKDGNPDQLHRSEWSRKKLRNYGYNTLVLNMYPVNLQTRLTHKLNGKIHETVLAWRYV